MSNHYETANAALEAYWASQGITETDKELSARKYSGADIIIQEDGKGNFHKLYKNREGSHVLLETN